MAPLRVALIGCGIISEAHINAYKQHANRARITVCCDVDEQKAAQRAALVGDARVMTSFEQVLADPDIDAVEICTPHFLHTDLVVAAARAGKHILCQKPLANTLAECDTMIAATKEAGVTFFYGEMNHTLPATMAARKLVEQGRIGRLVGIQATYGHWQGGTYLSTAWRYNPAVAGGGHLLDGGIHYITIMRHVGGPVHSVASFTTNFRQELGGEDTSVVNMRFEGGHLGTMFSSHAIGVWFSEASFVAFGTEGFLTIGGRRGALVLHRRDLPDGHEVILAERGDPFADMIGRYLDTVVDGAPNVSPGEVGRADLKIVLAAYKSAETGREVRLDEIEPNER